MRSAPHAEMGQAKGRVATPCILGRRQLPTAYLAESSSWNCRMRCQPGEGGLDLLEEPDDGVQVNLRRHSRIMYRFHDDGQRPDEHEPVQVHGARRRRHRALLLSGAVLPPGAQPLHQRGSDQVGRGRKLLQLCLE